MVIILARDIYLAHYGVKGQKWGVRRFQNRNGTLTAAGKKQIQAEKDKRKQLNKQIKDDAKTLRKAYRMGDVDVYDKNGKFVSRVNPGLNYKSQLTKKKGKAYVEKVENKMGKMYLRDVAVLSSVTIGAAVAYAYLD